MRFVTAKTMRELDRQAAEAYGLPTAVLMRRAGLAVAEAVRRVATIRGVRDLPVLVFAGHGNNGGDAKVAAEFLHEWGLPTMSCVGDTPHGCIVVDGLLGTGIQGDPRGETADAIRTINRLREERGAFVVAIDIPSGMNADTGECGHPCVCADLTVTMALPKLGMASEAPEVLGHCGRIEVADIGFPSELTGPEEENGLALIAGASVERPLSRRKRDAHKGDFGHVALVGGSKRYTGAISLAAEAAARSGAGLVTVATVPEAAAVVRARVPEAMVVSEEMGFPDGRYSALVMGPGLGRTDKAWARMCDALRGGVPKAVVDADALALLAGHPEAWNLLPRESVLTPHPGEAALILGTTAATVQRDRPAALRALVEKTGATVVLKGAGTLVGAPGRGRHLLRGGNPGMATGGSGDVLAGMIGGLLAQGLDAWSAARAGVWAHARNGDEAAWYKGEAFLLARDLF